MCRSVIETINVFNNSLYSLITPETLMYWIRICVANGYTCLCCMLRLARCRTASSDVQCTTTTKMNEKQSNESLLIALLIHLKGTCSALAWITHRKQNTRHWLTELATQASVIAYLGMRARGKASIHGTMHYNLR